MATTASGSPTATPSSKRKLYNIFLKPGNHGVGLAHMIALRLIGGFEYVEAENLNTTPAWMSVWAEEHHITKLLTYPDIDRVTERGDGDDNLVEERWKWNVFPKCPQDYDQIVQTEIFLTSTTGSPPEPAYMDGELQFWIVEMSDVQKGRVGRHPGVDEIDATG